MALATLVAISLFLPALTVKADEPQTSASPLSWSGIYAGVQAGGAWADTGWHFPIDSYFTLPAGKRSFDARPDGGIVGGHITWNR